MIRGCPRKDDTPQQCRAPGGVSIVAAELTYTFRMAGARWIRPEQPIVGPTRGSGRPIFCDQHHELSPRVSWRFVGCSHGLPCCCAGNDVPTERRGGMGGGGRAVCVNSPHGKKVTLRVYLKKTCALCAALLFFKHPFWWPSAGNTYMYHMQTIRTSSHSFIYARTGTTAFHHNNLTRVISQILSKRLAVRCRCG